MITTKDKPEGRVDDPYLVEKMIAEKEGIFLWCLEGLKQLVANNYRFTISERSKDNIDAIVKDANNIDLFDGALVDEFLDHATIHSRTDITFHLKCGLNLLERM